MHFVIVCFSEITAGILPITNIKYDAHVIRFSPKHES
jgi:hypothetical protein